MRTTSGRPRRRCSPAAAWRALPHPRQRPACRSSRSACGSPSQNHFAATSQRFPRVLVDDGLVCGHKDAAVFFAAERPNTWSSSLIVPPTAQRLLWQFVMAYGLEFRHTRGARRLDNANICNIVGHKSVKLQAKLFGSVPCCDFSKSYRPLSSHGHSRGIDILCTLSNYRLAVYEIDAVFVKFGHDMGVVSS